MSTSSPQPLWCRIATEADLEDICRLSDVVQALHADARPDIFRSDVDQDGREMFFRTALESDTWHFRVAGHGEEVQGYAMAEIFHKETGPIRHGFSEAHIHQICVAENARRGGVGSALLDHLLKDLKAQNPDRITVAYWSFNAASEAFFAAHGFDPVVTTAELNLT